ncbi:hypothetical protein P885DRAFT_47005 [Corynascus similis CBS 632.67]
MYTNSNERGIRNTNHPNAAAGGAPSGMTYGQSAASGPAPTTAGHHKHDILNKLDPRVDSTHDRQPVTQAGSNIPEGTYGPHSSRIANALDPRVDSDLDSTRAGAGLGAGGGLGGGSHTTGVVGGAGGYGNNAGTAYRGGTSAAAHAQPGQAHVVNNSAPEGAYGPHSSRLANTLDPRVDSDRDRHVGPGATHAPGVGHHATAVGGAGTTTAPATGAAAPRTAGPHKSDMMNKLDPRVDSTTGAWKGGSGSRGAY